MTTADVLFFSSAPLRSNKRLAESEPPLTKSLEVSPGLYLGPVDEDIASAVFHVCKFRDLAPDEKTPMYGFARENAPGGFWDSDEVIQKALYLSHIVQPHQGGFEFAARIQVEKKKVQDAKCWDVLPSYARAYPCVGVKRRWLTQEDGDTLKELIAGYNASRDYLKDKRLGAAVSLYTDSPFIYQGRPRAALLAAILEGLVSTDPERAFKQFTVRVTAIAAELRLGQYNKKWAEDIYKLRSRLAHGSPLFESPEEVHRRTVQKEIEQVTLDMDELLRALLKRSLREREFAERIVAVDEHWPVMKKGCVTCRSKDGSLVPVFCPRCSSQL